MKISSVLVLLLLNLTLSGATYYVSPSGSDSNPGTISQPFFTLNKAWTVVGAGDIIYMRGGTYNYGATGTTLSGKNGSAGSPISILAYPGEYPVIDYMGTARSSQLIGISISSASYLYLKGIRVTRISQAWNGSNYINQYGLRINSNVSQCTFERMETDHIGGWGISNWGQSGVHDLLYLNCDSHNNADPGSGDNYSYGGADGFQNEGSATGITFRGCRSWSNSDDGWDIRTVDGIFTLENCWSFWNGYREDGVTKGGDGEGLKLGNSIVTNRSDTRRFVRNCLVFENRWTGMESAQDDYGYIGVEVYNTVVYGNGEGINFNYAGPTLIRNSVSYNNGSADRIGGGGGTCTHDHNSFDSSPAIIVSNADFVSVSSKGVNGERQSDGSLPVSNYLKLASGSKFIDAGVNVGIPYGGNAPDLGAFEIQTSAITQAIPIYSSSVVENATPSLLSMTYNMTLANVVPVASSFSVRINSVVRTVTAVVVSGTKVQLTLASPVVSGDVVTVTYTIPASNPLQTTSGGQAIAISAQPVTNNINSIKPVYVSAAIENATPSLLSMTYNMTLANVVPVASAFSVSVNSVTRTVTTIAVSGTKVQLTLASPIVSSDVVTVTYTKPANNPLQTTPGGIAASISNQAVINNRINVAPTAVITSPVTNSSFTALSSITITANALDADGSVSVVEFYSGTIRIGSTSAAPYSFTWSNVAAGTYSLTAIAADNLNKKTTSSVVSISVINGKPTANRHPLVRISNPRKGIVYDKLSTITIDAIASDPDGTVTKVEFYNSTVRLVELTSAPYTYTWKDVAAGSYSITAIATDNLNDTTVSTPVEFVVGAKVKYDANSDIVKLYPNPNDGHFSIEFLNPLQNEKSEIVITDLAGKQIYNSPILKEETLKQFDLSSSKSGIYVMLIKDKEILVTKKFIKN